MANMKVTLQKLTKESKEKEGPIKVQKEKIAKLTKKLEKWSAQSSTKGLESEDLEKVFVYSELSDSEKQPKIGGLPKNDKSSGSMTVEQVQDLIANAVKAQLGGSHITHLYTKPYTKRVNTLCMPHGYQPLKFHSLKGKITLSSVSRTSLRHAIILGLMETSW